MLTEEELAKLVPAAHQGDSSAIEKLCESFAPLVFRISHRQTVYNVLGEDAENTLWVWFLEIISTYTGNEFISFPGFVRRHLVLRVMNIMKYYRIRYEREQLSSMDVNSPVMGVAFHEDYNFLDVMALYQEVTQLPDIQSNVLMRFYQNDETFEQIAVALDVAPRTARHYRTQAVAGLRKKLV